MCAFLAAAALPLLQRIFPLFMLLFPLFILECMMLLGGMGDIYLLHAGSS